MTQRVFNFSPGPAMLPLPVLEQAQRELVGLPGVGMSVLEISHRGTTFEQILESAENGLRQLLEIPPNYRILFLQGGSRLQFSMVPMNLAEPQAKVQYILTGSWGKKAYEEAVKQCAVSIAWDGKEGNYHRVPLEAELRLDASAAYLHFTSNETIQGVQFAAPPKAGPVPLVCDASSDFLSRPIQIDHYALIYACAQKNAGPAGVTIVIIREDLLDRSHERLPGYLNYREHAQEKSLFNTPPTFAIYIVDLVAKWLADVVGGLDRMYQKNLEKAKMLYDAIDDSGGFYRGHAERQSRSIMNVTFRLHSDALQKQFLDAAREGQLVNLEGHRSVGGIRASIYNAMPIEGVERLHRLMTDFRKRHA
jgi:phosphoserine aminotransferase